MIKKAKLSIASVITMVALLSVLNGENNYFSGRIILKINEDILIDNISVVFEDSLAGINENTGVISYEYVFSGIKKLYDENPGSLDSDRLRLLRYLQ